MTADPVRVTGYLDAADTNSTLDAVQALGALVERHDARADDPRHRAARRRARRTDVIDVGNAGHADAAAAGLAGRAARRELDARRRRVDPPPPGRPDRRAAAARWARGSTPARTASRRSRSPGSPLRGIEYELPVASAQIKSCVLLAGLVADGRHHRDRARAEPRPHRAPAAALRRRHPPRRRPDRASEPQDELELRDLHVPGDPSSAAFHVAAAVLVPGSRIVIEGMAANWTRDRLPAHPRADGRRCSSASWSPTHAPLSPDEPVTELDVAAGPLVGTTVDAAEVPLAIDELPLVALLGCFAEGETVVRGAAELRVKETDRIATVVDGLRGLGAEIEATADGFVVQGTGGLRGGVDRLPRRPPARDARRRRRPRLARGRRGRRDGGGRGLLPGLRDRPRLAALGPVDRPAAGRGELRRVGRQLHRRGARRRPSTAACRRATPACRRAAASPASRRRASPPGRSWSRSRASRRAASGRRRSAA